MQSFYLRYVVHITTSTRTWCSWLARSTRNCTFSHFQINSMFILQIWLIWTMYLLCCLRILPLVYQSFQLIFIPLILTLRNLKVLGQFIIFIFKPWNYILKTLNLILHDLIILCKFFYFTCLLFKKNGFNIQYFFFRFQILFQADHITLVWL